MVEKVLLMHGDTLCTDDVDYLKFRKKVRNPLIQKLFLWRSLDYRRHFAERARAKSRQHTESAPPAIMDVTAKEVNRVMQHHNTACLIHGHTHRPAIHELTLNDNPAQRIVLAAWHHQGNMLICHKNGDKEIVDFD